MSSLTASASRSSATETPLDRPWPGPAKGDALTADIQFTPSFALDVDDGVFTIGSELARALETRLAGAGIYTPMYFHDLAQRLAELEQQPSFTNKSNPASIRSEIEWACGADRPPMDSILLGMDGERAFDLCWTPASTHGVPVQSARHAHRILARLMRRIRTSRAVFIALGELEVWRDALTGLRLNAVPPQAAMRAEPERFSVEVMTYEEVREDLEAIHAALTSHGFPGVRIVVAVCPAPIARTFRDVDPRSANAYGKAVLRTATEAFAAAHDNVDYFPAYEMATADGLSSAFEADGRPLRPAAAAQIAERFIAAYGAGLNREAARNEVTRADPRELYTMIKRYFEAGKYDDAVVCIERLVSVFGDQHEAFSTNKLRMRYGGSLSKLGRRDEAVEQFKLAAGAHDASAVNLLKCADVLARAGEIGAAEEALEAALLKGATPEEVQSRKVWANT